MRTRLLILLLVSVACLVSSAQASESANLFAMQDGFVDSHGALIYPQSVGRGTPLMIVHGGPGASHDYFLPYLLPLIRTSRLVFIDERGSGKSSKFEDPGQYTIANMVEDIEAVRLALGLGKISLLGHSFGGAYRSHGT
jgi:proline iminopeptidase